MKFNTLSTQAVTILLLSICISVTTSSRKCTATLNSAAYANSWEKPNVKWKSPKHASDGVIDATIHGRIEVPTDLGGTTKAHVCYAQIRVNLTDCTFVRGANATSWDPYVIPHLEAFRTSIS